MENEPGSEKVDLGGIARRLPSAITVRLHRQGGKKWAATSSAATCALLQCSPRPHHSTAQRDSAAVPSGAAWQQHHCG
eukprot:5587028-Pleurochrysis_carterae.AAC.1